MKIFNTTNIAALCMSSALMLTSCESIQNANNTQKGAAIGTASGAVIGGILGNNIGTGKIAALGAVSAAAAKRDLSGGASSPRCQVGSCPGAGQSGVD